MMHMAISVLAGTALFAALGFSEKGTPPPEKKRDVALSVHQFKVRTIDGEEVSLAKYRGQVCLIVNVASR